jgi:hypothetical protein
MAWYNPNGYRTLLARLAQVGNSDACFITGMHAVFCGPVVRPLPLDENLALAAEGGHKVAAYVAALLLYLANDGTDHTARQHMTQAVAVEESGAARAGGGGTMLSNEECYPLRQRAVDVIWAQRGR